MFLKTIFLLLVAERVAGYFDQCTLHSKRWKESGREYFPGSVYVSSSGSLTLKRLVDPKADVYGFFNDQLYKTGWGVLEFKAGYGNTSRNGDIIFKAAGYLEGYLTAHRIQQHRCNIFVIFFGENPQPKKLAKFRTFFAKQDSWMRKMVATYKKTDPYWRHVGYILAQFDGLVAGYQAASEADSTLMVLDIFDFQVMNGAGDMLDLNNVLFPHEIPDFKNMTKQELMAYVHRASHCSALIKLLPGYEDVFMSHSSWFSYSATNRIFKHYDFNTNDSSTAANALSFSSYPGFLESLDDYYMMNNQMIMIQTTNNIFNTTLYSKVKPQSLLSWQRVRLANHLATNGSSWFKAVKQFNSGTYNNQYMVLDLTKLKLGKVVEDNALWVVEQIPGLVLGQDVTPIFRMGHWPSFNVPFFEEIYRLSGYSGTEIKHINDYQMAPRAKIFRRDAANVKDMASMKAIMRYNDFPSDPYSTASPWDAICSRGDLDPNHPSPGGCYDTKVSNLKMALERKAEVINGPTRGSGLGEFEWDQGWKNTYHWGLPDKYNFSFIPMQPVL